MSCTRLFTSRPKPWLRIALLAMTVELAVISSTAWSQKNQTPKATIKETPDAHLGKGYDALKQDRYDVAAYEFRAALALDPKLVLRARFPLAVALFELHKP